MKRCALSIFSCIKFTTLLHIFTRRFSSKLLSTLLVVSFIVPTAFLAFPARKAEGAIAIGGCAALAAKKAAVAAAALAKSQGGAAGGAAAAPSAAASVPVYDASVHLSLVTTINNTLGQIAVSSAITQMNTDTLTEKEICYDNIFYFAAKILINTMTKSIVSWINSGFQGSPSFVTNLDQFLLDAADQVAGQLILEELGELGEVLCSPFDLDIRLALAINYVSSNPTVQSDCRLSEVFDNVENGFNDFVGNNSGQGGWSTFFDVSVGPSNNPYDAYVRTEGEFNARITGKHNIDLTQTAWGRGFKSFVDEVDNVIKTPGAVVENQLEHTLGSGIRQLELADEFNEIIGALIGQLIQKVMSESGLLGAGSSEDSGGFLDKDDTDGLTDADKTAPLDPNAPSIDPTNPDDIEIPEDNTVKPPRNIAVSYEGGVASMSSTVAWSNGPGQANNGINDNCNGEDETDQNCAISEAVPNSWWYLALKEQAQISTIRIYRRVAHPFGPAYVVVSENPIPNNLTNPAQQPGAWYQQIGSSGVIPITINLPAGTKGRYIKIIQPAAQHLQLTEVEVVGQLESDFPEDPGTAIPVAPAS